MNRYYYNKQTDILEFTAEGIVKIDVILDYYNHVFNNESYPRNLRALIDCRKAVFEIEAQSLNPTFDLIKNNIHKFQMIKEAILVETPIEAAIATLFEMLNSKIKNYSFNVFSTEEASMKWLLE